MEELAFELQDNVYQKNAALKRGRPAEEIIRLSSILQHQDVTARPDRKGRKCVVCTALEHRDKDN